jgi:hypothetical protein
MSRNRNANALKAAYSMRKQDFWIGLICLTGYFFFEKLFQFLATSSAFPVKLTLFGFD